MVTYDYEVLLFFALSIPFRVVPRFERDCSDPKILRASDELYVKSPPEIISKRPFPAGFALALIIFFFLLFLSGPFHLGRVAPCNLRLDYEE